MLVYAMRDKKMESFGNLLQAPNDDAAIRSLEQALREGGGSANLMAQYPEDFVLYHIGDFDENTGAFVQTESQPRVVVVLAAVRDGMVAREVANGR